MNDDLRAGLDSLACEKGDKITRMKDRKEFPGIASSGAETSEFMPGIELLESTIVFRISRTHLTEKPELQSRWMVDGKIYKLTKCQPSSASTVLILDDPN